MSTPASPRPLIGRAERFAIGYVLTVIVAGLIAVALGYGNHSSRVALGLDAPDAPVAVQVALQRVTVEEDDPRWDCRTMGNRTCGVLAPFGGPVLRTTGTGGVRVVCPTGGTLVDVPTGRGCAY